MRAAFIGTENKIAVYSNIIKNAIASSELSAISICGVLSVSIEATANLAISLNTKAYLSLDDLLREADIVFVCRHDSQLASFSELMKEKRVRGKIFCHFSTRHDSSVLSCGSTNTCYSIGLPYSILNATNPQKLVISFEGEGKHCVQFESIIKSIFPKAVFCSKSEKRMASIASRILTEYTKILIKISAHFFKMSGLYDEESFTEFSMRSIKDVIATGGTKQIRKLPESEIKKDMRLLSVIHSSDTRDFYKNMETHIAVSGGYDVHETEEILKTLKKKY